MNGFSFEFGKKKTFGVANPYPGNIIINPSFDDGGNNWTIRDGEATISGGNAVLSGDGLQDGLINSVEINSASSYTMYVDFSWSGDIEVNREMYLDLGGGSFISQGLAASGASEKTGSGSDVASWVINTDGFYNRPGIVIALTGVATVTIHGIYLVPN